MPSDESKQLGLAVGTSENRQSVVQSCRPRKTASTLCPVDFVADRGGCNGDSPRVRGFGTASATPLIERSPAPSPSTATELSPRKLRKSEATDAAPLEMAASAVEQEVEAEDRRHLLNRSWRYLTEVPQ